MYTYSCLPPIIQIKSNLKLPYKIEKKGKPRSEVEITLNLIKDLETPNFGFPYNFEHCFFGEWNADEMSYEPTFGSPIKAKMRLRNLLSNNPEILVNRTYCRLFKRKIGGAETPTKQLTDIIMVKLLERDFALMHGAAFCSNGEGIVLAAPTRTGKSTTTSLAIRRGYDFIAEDTSATDGEKIYSINRIVSPTLVHGLDRTLYAKFQVKLIDLMNNKLPFLPFLMKVPDFNLTPLAIPRVESARIKYLIFLSWGKEEVVELNKQEALQRILVLSKIEFPFHGNKSLLTYSYLNPALDLPGLVVKEEKVFTRLVYNHPCFLCTAEDPRYFINLIEEIR